MKKAGEGIHLGSDTQNRHHQKSKTGISGPTKRTCVLQKLQTKKINRTERYSPLVGAGLGITPGFSAPEVSASGLMDAGFTTKFLGSAPGGSVTTIVPSADSTAVAMDTTVLGIVPGTVTLMVDSVVDVAFNALLLPSSVETVAIVTDPVDLVRASVCEDAGAPRVI